MATITFGKTGTRPYGVLTVTETSTSAANNTSTLSIKLVLKRPYSISSSATKTAKCTINGTTYSWSGTIGGSGDKTLISQTQTVKHNDDGTKTINISASITLEITWDGSNIGTISGSGTMALTNIARYATVSQTLSAKTETTIIMNWTSDSTIDYIWYSSNNGSTWTGYNTPDGKSGSYTISGLNPNTTYKVKTRVRRKDNQLTTDSAALSVETYAYPYCNSMPNFTIGNKLTLGFYNPLSRSITANILGADGSQISNDTTTGTSISGYAGSVVVDRLYASIPNSQSGTYKVKVTYGSQVNTKTGGTYTVNKNNCAPSIGGVSYKDTNSTSVAITGNNQDIVRNQSIVEYTATGLQAQKYATVRSCSVSINGNSYNLALSGNNASGGNATVDSASTITAVFTVTDSRGVTGTKSINVNMLDWTVPSAIINLHRQDNYYPETDITVDANYSSINGNNRITITYQGKKEGDTEYSISGTLQDNVQSTFVANNDYDWDIEVTLVDSFGGQTTYHLWLSMGIPIIYFDRKKSSVGVSCFPADKHSLEVKGANIYDALFYSEGDSLELVGDSSTNYSNRLMAGGMYTSSGKEVWFSIPTPKSMVNVTPSLATLRVNVRKVSGGYLYTNAYTAGGYDVLNDSNLTVICAKSIDNMLTIEIQSTAGQGETNNTPVIVAVENLLVNFS